MGGEGRTSQSLQRRVFTVLTLMAVVASTLVVIVMALLFQNAIVRDAHEQLGRECEIVASIEDDSPNIAVALEDIDFGDVRVTIIDPDGDVVYDNQVEANRLPNHADRSEVAEALEHYYRDVDVVPSFVCGGTDAIRYEAVCDSILRVIPFRPTPEEEATGVHGVNERISRRTYAQGIRVLVRLLESTIL